jgi:hypothetical protein
MADAVKKLSDKASRGQWGVFDDRGTLEIGHAEGLGERPCIVGWSGFDSSDKPKAEQRANAMLIVALVNAYRNGELDVLEAPTELQVQAGAVILATTPLIDAPKLSHDAWMGLSRSILEAAYAARR